VKKHDLDEYLIFSNKKYLVDGVVNLFNIFNWFCINR